MNGMIVSAVLSTDDTVFGDPVDTQNSASPQHLRCSQAALLGFHPLRDGASVTMPDVTIYGNGLPPQSLRRPPTGTPVGAQITESPHTALSNFGTNCGLNLKSNLRSLILNLIDPPVDTPSEGHLRRIFSYRVNVSLQRKIQKGDDLEDVNEEDLEDEAVKTSDEEEDFEDPPRGGRGG
ncbi:hypothetical protein FPV67DRAFT_1460814 [Lyophyllum atratum]|nr:hypothetical protein FPV67DRAFT_1460814 [Lyophyllum atratum]